MGARHVVIRSKAPFYSYPLVLFIRWGFDFDKINRNSFRFSHLITGFVLIDNKFLHLPVNLNKLIVTYAHVVSFNGVLLSLNFK